MSELFDDVQALVRDYEAALARIAELEAERNTERGVGIRAALHIFELEAEVDRLKAALRHIATTADIGLNIGPVIRMAKAALAPAEGEG